MRGISTRGLVKNSKKISYLKFFLTIFGANGNLKIDEHHRRTDVHTLDREIGCWAGGTPTIPA